MNKKALTPLSSTLVLLAISIVIGLIVMTWGRSYVEQATLKGDNLMAQEKSANLAQDLNVRLQNGEITQEQYDQLSSVINKQNS